MMRWLVELILGPRPSLHARARQVDDRSVRAMKARQEAMRLRFEVITRGKGPSQ